MPINDDKAGLGRYDGESARGEEPFLFDFGSWCATRIVDKDMSILNSVYCLNCKPVLSSTST